MPGATPDPKPNPALRKSRGERTRASMLDAATERLNQASMEELLGFLRPEEIAAAAGRSKATFFHHWPNQAAFIDDLIEGRPNRRSQAVEGAASFLDELEPGDPRSWVSRMRSAALAAFDGLTTDPRLSFAFLGPLSGDPVEHSRLRERHRLVDQLIVSLADEHLAVTDLSVREPFTVSSLAVAVHSLAIGLAARARVNPEGATAVLFADVLTALLPAVVTNVGADSLPLDEFIENAMTRPFAKQVGSVSLGFTPDPARVETAQQASAIYSLQIVPRLARALDEQIDNPPQKDAETSSGTTAARQHLERLREAAARYPTATLAVIGLLATRSLADEGTDVPDVPIDTGLLAVTRRALLMCGPMPRAQADAVARSAISAMLRSAVGLEAVEPPVLIAGVLAMLEAAKQG